jgi:hypothetical protein
MEDLDDEPEGGSYSPPTTADSEKAKIGYLLNS